MNRDVLDEAIQAEIERVLQIQVGMSDVPSATPTVPYAILFWSPSPGPEGSYADPEDMPYFDYLFKSVGRDHKETARTGSRIRDLMVGRRPGGFSYNINAAGFTIVNRHTVSLGQIIKGPAPDLFELNDIYRFCVTG